MKTKISGIVSGVYKMEDVVNGYVYVGSSNDIAKRWSNHMALLKNEKHRYQELQSSWDDDIRNIKWEILEKCPESLLKEREAHWMEHIQKIDGWILINKQKEPAKRTPVRDTSRMSAAQTGECNGNSKYPIEIIKEVKRKLAEGINNKQIALETGISESYISLIKSGRRWSSVVVD